jgi:O-antigen ligase
MRSDSAIPPRVPFYFLLACMVFPFGVAVQNIVMVLCAGALGLEIFQKKNKETWSQLSSTFRVPFLSALLFIAWGIIARMCNENISIRFPVESFGYWLWALLPLLYRMRYGQLQERHWKKIGHCLVAVCVGWGLLVLSQYLWRWRLIGVSIAVDDGRPKGLFSHPLSLAYAACLLWPLAIQWCLRFPKKVAGWLLLVSIGGILILTRSRTVQAFSLLLVLWNLFFLLRGSLRIAVLSLLLLTVGGVLSTDNLISHNLRTMLAGQSVDRHSGYPDDRLAFWHVHANMFLERPFMGHGFGISEKYRMPYYEAIGLPDFIKPYPAHNLFLQVLVNEGLLGFSFFLVWIGWYLQACRTRVRSALARSVFLQTWWLFLLTGLTQNSFQDAGVRMCLTLFCMSIWLSIDLKKVLIYGKHADLGGQLHS